MNGAAWPAYAGIMFATGIGIPVMAAANATLGARLGSAPTAAGVLFGLAFVVAALAAMLSGGPKVPLLGAAPWPFYMAGLAVAFYVLSITAIAPRLGLANAVFFVLIGQVASAAVIDHFGLFGAARSELGIVRASGVILMAAGVFLAQRSVSP